jgi:hypothetical protein
MDNDVCSILDGLINIHHHIGIDDRWQLPAFGLLLRTRDFGIRLWFSFTGDDAGKQCEFKVV